MTKKILLTGGTGFLGSHLLERLLKDGHQIILLKRSHSNLSRVEKLLDRIRYYNTDLSPLSLPFEENEIDVIIHCATSYGRRSIPSTEMVEANLTLPLHLLQLAEKHGVCAFINTDTILDKRINRYSLSKKQFLDWLQVYSQHLVCINVALEHFYGPFDDRSKFVSNMIQHLLSGVSDIDLTEGIQKRDFIHVDDVVEAFVKILGTVGRQRTPGFRQYEVGTGRCISIRELVETIKDLSGNEVTRLNFGAIPFRENEVMESRVDISKLRELNWSPKIQPREGLLRTIEAERAHLEAAARMEC